MHTFTAAIDRQLFYQFISVCQIVYSLKGFVKFRDLPEVTYEFQLQWAYLIMALFYKDVPMTIIIGESLDTDRLRNQLDMIQFT